MNEMIVLGYHKDGVIIMAGALPGLELSFPKAPGCLLSVRGMSQARSDRVRSSAAKYVSVAVA